MTRLPANTVFKLWRQLPAVKQHEWKVGNYQHQRDSAAAAAQTQTFYFAPVTKKAERRALACVNKYPSSIST